MLSTSLKETTYFLFYQPDEKLDKSNRALCS
jgi:hypothetical protein